MKLERYCTYIYLYQFETYSSLVPRVLKLPNSLLVEYADKPPTSNALFRRPHVGKFLIS